MGDERASRLMFCSRWVSIRAPRYSTSMVRAQQRRRTLTHGHFMLIA